jgi:hypothetical protein
MKKCPHGKQKDYCVECGGNGICSHGKQHYYCKECGGKGICEHNLTKRCCKICNPNYYCIHDRVKRFCRDCGGVDICIHNNRRQICIECKGQSLCIHNKPKVNCVECSGSMTCIHKKLRSNCIECGGSNICSHGKRKQLCVECKGSRICEHDKRKEYCKICDGKYLCKTPNCEIYAQKKYNGYCLRCAVYQCPDLKVYRNYKTKENTVVDLIKQKYPNFDWYHDKKIKDGCSLRRPDLILDLGSHLIDIEVDENKHNEYECSCENKRLMEISQDVGHRPIVFIRFNPDSYFNENGEKVLSCWLINKHGICYIPKNREPEWNKRINILLEQIQYWIDNETTKTIEIIELFY